MSQDLMEELLTEINGAAEAPNEVAEAIDLDLLSRIDEIQIQGAAIARKYANFRIDFDDHRHKVAKGVGELRSRQSELEESLTSIVQACTALKSGQQGLSQAIAAAETDIEDHEARVNLLEAKMTRAVEVFTQHERLLIKMKRQRFTITTFLLAAAAIALWGNFMITVGGGVHADSRLDRIEQVLGR